ncbi:MAG: alpha/beta hydrolase family protein [Pseudorhodoplanes sp.]|uniref:alpha/beta hydrolase family protein n=1 Tax=Pseudorhodoplanes sp. TaxID=1934341 RepID=UPI003D0E281E
MRTIGQRSIRTAAGAIFSGCLLALTVVTPSQAQTAADEFVSERTFFRTTIDGKSVRLEGFVLKRADLTGRLPIALITHGKSANLADMLALRASDYTPYARDLARRGYLSVVVIRRGFGQSDGPMPVNMTCESKSFNDLFTADADDLQGALELASRRPDADPERAIAIGVSAGGAAVMALAARNPKNLRGVINVSGGLQTPSCPKDEALVSAFKDYGSTGRVPSIWIYAKNDSLFNPSLVERMQSAYLDGGGDVKLVMYDKFGKDGHEIFGDPNGRLRWLMEMDGFLRFHDLPATRRDQIAELLKLTKLEPRHAAFIDQYLAAPTSKVMVQTPDGNDYMTQYGASSLELARGALLKTCQERHKSAQPCKVVMENDTWVGPTVPERVAAGPADRAVQ